jgi:hypothetical protein
MPVAATSDAPTKLCGEPVGRGGASGPVTAITSHSGGDSGKEKRHGSRASGDITGHRLRQPLRDDALADHVITCMRA